TQSLKVNRCKYFGTEGVLHIKNTYHLAPPSSLSYAFLLGLPEWLAGCRCCLPDQLTKLPLPTLSRGNSSRRCHHFPRAWLLGHTHCRTSRGGRWAGAATHCEGAQYCNAGPDHRTLHHRVCCRWSLAATFTLALVAGATASTPGRGVLSSGKLPCLSHAPTTAPHDPHQVYWCSRRWISRSAAATLPAPHVALYSLAIAVKQTSSKPSPFSLLLLSIEQATITSSNPKL
ncbi:unnamed protein product, partial [Urochloa humidicola]